MTELLGLILDSFWSFLGTLIILGILGDILVKMWTVAVGAIADVAKEAVRGQYHAGDARVTKPDPEFMEY